MLLFWSTKTQSESTLIRVTNTGRKWNQTLERHSRSRSRIVRQHSCNSVGLSRDSLSSGNSVPQTGHVRLPIVSPLCRAGYYSLVDLASYSLHKIDLSFGRGTAAMEPKEKRDANQELVRVALASFTVKFLNPLGPANMLNIRQWRNAKSGFSGFDWAMLPGARPLNGCAARQ